ncbi:proline-rich receptor-like protein kinase PERK8 [Iris pallida]|uniref:Proline-rich receptor-like protein kinase PERK8 n=1 Tax=Iris pallida TaxID=29817 RepID=A0AAX6FX58_IRIPA|nr:proline-rich receptor-like protein kinase PERK8 [Iris pallida]
MTVPTAPEIVIVLVDTAERTPSLSITLDYSFNSLSFSMYSLSSDLSPSLFSSSSFIYSFIFFSSFSSSYHQHHYYYYYYYYYYLAI